MNPLLMLEEIVLAWESGAVTFARGYGAVVPF